MGEPTAECEIVAGLRQGSRDAWNALCNQYSSHVWRYVSRLVGSDPNSVADVYQETMLAVARSGRTLAAETRLRAWLSRIAHNQAALHWRKRYRSAIETTEIDRLTNNHDDDPATLLAQAERTEAIRKLMADMDSEQVWLLSAKYLDDMSIAEIVEEYGSTTEGVRSKLARARREFKARYERLTVG